MSTRAGTARGYAIGMWLAAALLLTPGVQAQAPSQVQRVTFDAGAQLVGGIDWSFSRPDVARASTGEIASPDEPRFAEPTLLAGAPSNLVKLTTQSTVRAYAAGYDGVTPVLVIDNATLGLLDIHVGHDADKHAYLDGDLSGTYRFHYVDASRDGHANLLMGQTGVDGGTASIPGYAFEPRGAQVCNGLIAVQCDVLHDDDGDGADYVNWKTALLWTTVRRLETTVDPWVVGAVSARFSPESTLSGQSWSINAYPLGPDECAVCLCSYQSLDKKGGHCYVTRFLRTKDWQLGDSVMMYEHEADNEHFHCAGVIRHPDGRMTVLVSIGDHIERNRLVARTLASGGVWASAEAWKGSGIDGSHEVSRASSDWTPATAVWGDDDPVVPRNHNQFVDAVAADPELSALICASDESNPAICRLEYDPDLQRCTWTGLYLPAVSSWVDERPVNLSLEGLPGGPYVSRLGAQSWMGDDSEESRVLYSPDGVHWTQCFAPHQRPQSSVAITDGRIWISSTGSSASLRTFDAPATRLSSPMQFAGSGQNRLVAGVPLPANVGDGVTVTKLAGTGDLPPGVPPPPCDDANMFQITGGGASGNYGEWSPTGTSMSLPRPSESVLVRFWVYAPGADGVSFVERTSPTLWIRVLAADGSGDKIDPKQLRLDRGMWIPVTAWFTPGQFGQAQLADPWNLHVLLHAESPGVDAAPGELLIAWDGIFIDRQTIDGHGAPPESGPAGEIGTIDGWQVAQNHTLIAAGWVPFDAWDNRMGGGTHFNTHRHTLLRLIDTTTDEFLDVVADPSTLGIGIQGNAGSPVDVISKQSVFWLRGSPVLLAIVTANDKTVLLASIGGEPVQTIPIPGVSLSFDRVELGHAPMLWESLQGVGYAMSDAEAVEALTALEVIDSCAADLNGDGALDILDFIAFQGAFVALEPKGDCNVDGRFDILDFLCFQDSFVGGCD